MCPLPNGRAPPQLARPPGECCGAQRPSQMLVVPAVQPSFPSFPTHHKANHESGRRMLDVYAQESSFQGERASVHKQRLGGNEDPTKLYEQGPRTWPSLALRKESDQVLEGSGIIGWCVTRRKTNTELPLTHWRALWQAPILANARGGGAEGGRERRGDEVVEAAARSRAAGREGLA